MHGHVSVISPMRCIKCFIRVIVGDVSIFDVVHADRGMVVWGWWLRKIFHWEKKLFTCGIMRIPQTLLYIKLYPIS